jgi:glycosyltransferase involved in cell wall biosynthesis
MRKKILFILPNLAAGGAERVISFVAQNIDKDRFESKLLIAGCKKDAAYSVQGVDVTFLEKNRVLTAIPGIFLYLMRHRPDVILSSVGHLNTVMGLMTFFFKKTKFIIREASVISSLDAVDNDNSNSSKFSVHSYLSHLSYKKTHNIICQSQDMADDFKNIYKETENKIVIINNPITQNFSLPKIEKANNEYVNFITVGRLSKEKGHLRIIKLLSQLKYKFHYTIIGSGPLKQEIFEAINQHQLQDNVTYIPFTKDVLEHMANSDLFLQGSYVEGFPNALLESCYAGTPVIAYNVPGGTKEIVVHKENGYLVQTDDDYLNFLNNMADFNPEEVRESVISRFSREKIVSQYEALFK